MAYTGGCSVNVGDPTKATDVTTLAANDDFLKAAVDAIMADSATPTTTLKAAVVLADGITATTQSAGNNTTRVATTAFVKTAVDASSTDPGGSDEQVQFNNGGAFGGSSALIFDDTDLTCTGDVIGSTLKATGDTAASDPANMGYTSAEGLILTGQGSTADVTIKNDADATVLSIPTGTQSLNIPLMVGAHTFGTNGGDSTAPDISIVVEQYASGETEGWRAFHFGGSSGSHVMRYGGGSATYNCATHHTFHTAANVTTREGSERMRIQPDGNVGIGVDGPGSRLTVVDASADTQLAYLHNTNASYDGNSASTLYVNNSASGGDGFNFIQCASGNASDAEFTLRGDGNAYADGSWSGSGADYQEFFESADGSALEVGKSVVMDGDKVRVYNASSDSTDNIIGVVRPKADNKNSAVIGNTAWNHWTDKYLTDDWGVYLREDVTVWAWDDDVRYADGDELPEGKSIGDVKIKAGSCYEFKELAKDPDWTPLAGATSSTQSIRKRNPAYDESLADNYKPRKDRAEWNLIGLLGQVQIKANEPTRPTWIKMQQISDSVDLWLVR